MKELLKIQELLDVPKNQFNDFGNYKFRSAEDILTAVKPLLVQNSCTLKLSDEVVQIGERYYIKATAKLTNSTGESEEAHGYAREALSKKGMDEAQVTGSTSSYARKYALNGLFAIDDEKDSDSTNKKEKNKAAEIVKDKMTPAQVKAVFAIATNKEWLDKEGMITIPDHKPFKATRLTKQEASRFINTYGEKKGEI